MSNGSKVAHDRRNVLKAVAGGGVASFGGARGQFLVAAAMAGEAGKSPKPLKVRLLERRTASDLVRAGQAGSGILG